MKEYCISDQEFIHVAIGGWTNEDVVPDEEWLQETWNKSIVRDEAQIEAVSNAQKRVIAPLKLRLKEELHATAKG